MTEYFSPGRALPVRLSVCVCVCVCMSVCRSLLSKHYLVDFDETSTTFSYKKKLDDT